MFADCRTPVDLLQARARALLRKDYSFIYDSYHDDAPFLLFFPERHSYLDYGRQTLAGEYRLLSSEVLREELGDGEARLLLRQSFFHNGAEWRQLEVVRCSLTPSGWRYQAGLKLSEERLPPDLLSCSWEELEAAGDNVWI